MRGHDVSSLHAAGNQLQTVEQRSAAVNGAGGAVEPSNRTVRYSSHKDLLGESTPMWQLNVKDSVLRLVEESAKSFGG
ncbi:uncharacterized [Lates japonicus]